MSLEYLEKLGASKTIIDAIKNKKQCATLNQREYELINKYEEAGLSTRAKIIERDKYLKNIPYLVIGGRVHIHFNVLEKYGLVPHLHFEAIERGVFGNKKTDRVLAVIPVSEYRDSVPEFIIDTIIKNKAEFIDFGIGIPASSHKEFDPILFGVKTPFPNSSMILQSKYMDLYVLGIWGDDWHELDLHSLQGRAKKDEC